MANIRRGEIEACLDGKKYKLCLTLGALAELESAFGDDDMLALAERFSEGRISANDAMKIIVAGLRGGGHKVDEKQVKRMRTDGGAAGFIGIVAKLLGATFGGPLGAAAGGVIGEVLDGAIAPGGSGSARGEGSKGRGGSRGGEASPDPFRGTR